MKRLIYLIFLLSSFTVFSQSGSRSRSEDVTISGIDTYTATLNTVTSLADGLTVSVRFTNANTGASTFNLTGNAGALGAKDLRKNDGTELSSGDITAGSGLDLRYDLATTQWRIVGGIGSSFTLTPGSGTTVGADLTSVDFGGTLTAPSTVTQGSNGISFNYTGTLNTGVTFNRTNTGGSIGTQRVLSLTGSFSGGGSLGGGGLGISTTFLPTGGTRRFSALHINTPLEDGGFALSNAPSLIYINPVITTTTGSFSGINGIYYDPSFVGGTPSNHLAAYFGSGSLRVGELSGSGTRLLTADNSGTVAAITTGTGVATSLGVNIGSSGAPVLFNGALGTPSSGTLTNATGLPPTTGISGWPANSSGVLTNNGSGTLSWGAGSTVASFAETLAGIDNTKVVTPLRLRQVNKTVYNVEAYGAVHDGVRLADGAISSGTDDFTSATAVFTADDVGKVISIAGAGAAGANLRTTISAFVSSTAVTIATNASTTVTDKLTFYGTDDTVAIQTTINVAFAAGGGKVYCPNGIYIIDGDLQTDVDGSNPNSQLYFPSNDDRDTFQPNVILEGESNYPLFIWWDLVVQAPVRFISTRQGSGTNPAVIGTIGSVDNNLNFNYAAIELRNIQVQVNSNGGASAATMSGVNLGYASIPIVEGVSAIIDSDLSSSVSPSASEVFGIWVSRINNGGPSILRNCTAMGFKYGYIIGEHTLIDYIIASGNYNGIVPLPGNYVSFGREVSLLNNFNQILIPNGVILGVDPGNTYVDWKASIEGNQVGKWYSTSTDIIDSGNRVYGSVMNAKNNGAVIGNRTGSTNLNMFTPQKVFGLQYNQAGGAVTATSGTTPGTVNNVVFELGSKVSTSGFTEYPHLHLTTNQTGTAHPVGTFAGINGSLGTAEKRLWELDILTDGATNTGATEEYLWVANTLTTVARKTGTSIRHALRTYMGGVATAPTARLHIAAGTTAASTAPIKLTSGTNLTTAETGAMEYNGTDLLFTPVGTNRLTVFTGYMGLATLVSGTVAVTTNGVGTGSSCIVTVKTPTGVTLTTQYQCVCTSNTITIQANVAAGTINTADGSVINYMVKP